jgi:branched-chain amino acid aminotransferase
MKKYFNYNGRFFVEDENVLSKDNRNYRYGDGLFETMKLINGNILLEDHHFERLFWGLDVLKFHIPVLFTKQKIETEIKELSKKNECERSARIVFQYQEEMAAL